MQSFVSLCVLCLAAGAVHAGVVFETVDRDIQSGKNSPAERWYVQSGNARIEGPDGVSIFKDGAVFALDPTDKSYHVMDQATMDQLSARVKQRRAEQQQKMQAELAKLPPEKRAAVEARLAKDGIGPKAKRAVDARDTGRTLEVNGRSCQVWDITRDETLDEQYCVASFASLPGGEEIQALMQKYQGFLEQMSDLMSGPGTARDTMRNEFELWKRLNGFPLITRGYADGKLESSDTVVSTWKSQAVAPAMFEVPGRLHQARSDQGSGSGPGEVTRRSSARRQLGCLPTLQCSKYIYSCAN